MPPGTESTRLDYYAAQVMPEIASATQARKLRQKGALMLNGAAHTEPAMVGPGDRFHYVIPDSVAARSPFPSPFPWSSRIPTSPSS